MTIILIALLTAVCILFILLRIGAMQLDKAHYIIERREQEIQQLEKRVYELTGMLQQAQRIVSEIEKVISNKNKKLCTKTF